jgi:hypothetical protein
MIYFGEEKDRDRGQLSSIYLYLLLTPSYSLKLDVSFKEFHSSACLY